MDFVAIDFETAQYAPESACSVGLVRFTNGAAGETYQSLVRPPKLYIRPDFTDIHGLTVADVRDAPRFSDLWERDILGFIGDSPLAAHNAQFDMNVLRAVLEWYGIKVPRLKYFCTLQIARKLWPHLPSRALTALGKTFNITYRAHDALDDARTCGQIACIAAREKGVDSVGDLLKASGLYPSYLRPSKKKKAAK
ncbi:MAG: 3'-5' exonuclease [Spirochaetaceae bacterium]|jgi:DNA polymerase-3 subunit epsilon|nr:3'-5' exonuclease [Spirochaetaceae bacterium]